jgi:biotin carboxylase
MGIFTLTASPAFTDNEYADTVTAIPVKLSFLMILFRKPSPSPPLLFVSIGAGTNQLPLINEARKLGYRTVGIDQNPGAAGFHRCDIRIQESVDSYTEIFNKMREIIMYGDVKGVLSRSYGGAVKSACYIAAKFNIPMIPYRRVDDFINKKRMKAVLSRNGLPTPRHAIIDRSASSGIRRKLAYPVVVKPVTGHAKAGVKLIRGPSELTRFISGIAPGKACCIAETFVDGDEVIAAGIVHHHHFHLVSMSDKEVTPLPYFVDLSHSAPSRHAHLWERIEKLGQGVAEAFDIATSPLIMEIRITTGGDITIIEAVPEFGGEYLPDILIPESTGYNFFREAIKAVTDTGFTPPVRGKQGKPVLVRYITAGAGTLESYNGLNPKRHPGVLFAGMFKSPGARVRDPKTNHDRIGVVAACGRTPQAAAEAAEAAIQALAIVIRRREDRP